MMFDILYFTTSFHHPVYIIIFISKIEKSRNIFQFLLSNVTCQPVEVPAGLLEIIIVISFECLDETLRIAVLARIGIVYIDEHVTLKAACATCTSFVSAEMTTIVTKVTFRLRMCLLKFK